MSEPNDTSGMTLYERIDYLHDKLRKAERAFDSACTDKATPFEDCEALLRSITDMSSEIDRLESLASDISQGR